MSTWQMASVQVASQIKQFIRANHQKLRK
jgi:hypothetical protein